MKLNTERFLTKYGTKDHVLSTTSNDNVKSLIASRYDLTETQVNRLIKLEARILNMY